MQKKRPVKVKPLKQMKAWMLVLIDILLIGLCLIVFALFDHVIPSQGVVAVSVPAFSGATLPPVTTQATDAPSEAPQSETAANASAATAEPVQSVPTEPPAQTTQVEQTVARVGDFSAKFPDKFTSGEVIVTENSYQSANVNVTVIKDSYHTVKNEYAVVYIEDIYIRDIECLRTVFAQDRYGKSITERVLDMATRVNSVCAINSDYYGFGNAGIVIRNGNLYRDTFEPGEQVLIIYRDGTFKVYNNSSELDVNQAMADGAWQSFSFGPSFLDENGELLDSYTRPYHDPRTVIGMIEPGHYLFIVVDGRQPGYSEGMTYAETAQLCYDLGCQVAYNLDGGRTTQMTFMDHVADQPYAGGRVTSDIVCIVDM